jgi:hypothetical protein
MLLAGLVNVVSRSAHANCNDPHFQLRISNKAPSRANRKSSTGPHPHGESERIRPPPGVAFSPQRVSPRQESEGVAYRGEKSDTPSSRFANEIRFQFSAIHSAIHSGYFFRRACFTLCALHLRGIVCQRMLSGVSLNHSYRNATIGSVCMARRAGTTLAARATIPSSRVTPPTTNGSKGYTS